MKDVNETLKDIENTVDKAITRVSGYFFDSNRKVPTDKTVEVTKEHVFERSVSLVNNDIEIDLRVKVKRFKPTGPNETALPVKEKEKTKFRLDDDGTWTAFPVKDSIYVITDHSGVDWDKEMEPLPVHYELDKVGLATEGYTDHNSAMQVLALLNAPEENMKHLCKLSEELIDGVICQIVREGLRGTKTTLILSNMQESKNWLFSTYIVTVDGETRIPVSINTYGGEKLYTKLLESFKQFK